MIRMPQDDALRCPECQNVTFRKETTFYLDKMSFHEEETFVPYKEFIEYHCAKCNYLLGRQSV